MIYTRLLLIFVFVLTPFLVFAQDAYENSSLDSTVSVEDHKKAPDSTEDADYHKPVIKEEDFSTAVGSIGTKRFSGVEGTLLDVDPFVGIIIVRYFSKNNPDVFMDISYYYDDETVVVGAPGVESLSGDDVVRVEIRQSSEKSQHFNIVRAPVDFAGTITLIKSNN